MYLKNDHALLDTLIKENNLKNDAGLSRALKVAPPVISTIRSGRMPVGDSIRLRVMRTFHWTIQRIDAVIPPAQG